MHKIMLLIQMDIYKCCENRIMWVEKILHQLQAGGYLLRGRNNRLRNERFNSSILFL